MGYSGGPDSKALLYSLLEWGFKHLQIAHVDHGWRSESADEAELLRLEAAELGLPFHSTRLQMKGKKEDEARSSRLAFFKKIAAEIGAQALLLAHQADDWAETALKRVLEGAHLAFLGGMEGVGEVEGLPIWRPLLTVKRSEIVRFIEKRKLIPLDDPTNRDPKYLRARMREKILPALNEAFGKEIGNNLLCLAERGAELKRYLDRRVEAIAVQRGEWGISAALREVERIEQRHLIQKISPVTIPRSVLEFLLDGLAKKGAKRRLLVKGQEIFIEGGSILFPIKDSGTVI